MAGIQVLGAGIKGDTGEPGPPGPPGIMAPVLLVLKPKLGKIIGKIAVTGGWVVVYDSV